MLMKHKVDIIGQSELIRELRTRSLQVAETDITVLIIGETGAGKEVLARFIHNNSLRAGRPFIPVNCGAIPSGILESELFGHEKGAFTGAQQSRKGYFESANTGTIFLDEIGEMPLDTQVKFLRVIETGEFQRVGASETIYSDARIIAATNKNMYQAVAEQHFREDLFYRLRSVELQIPPLRNRGSDILLLTEAFVREFQLKHKMIFEGFSHEATEMMLRYPWPGNVRELRNLVESLLVLEKGRQITPDILERHLVQRNRYKSLIHEPTSREQAETHELQLIYSTLIHLRQEVSELRMMVQHLLQNRPAAPILLPDSFARHQPTIQEPIPQPDAKPVEPLHSLEEIEKQSILQTLDACEGNKRKTAQTLGITERTLHRKLKTYGL